MSGFRGRGRGGGRGGGRSRPQGSFVKGQWHCECDPPLPAVHFQVKKEGPNKGRWFRTCSSKQCQFFLWDTDAQPRELAALSNNSRTEPSRSYPNTPSRPRAQTPPPYTPDTGPFELSRKRARPSFEDDDDDFDMGDSAAFEEEMGQVMMEMETPSKRLRTEPFGTPATVPGRRKLPWQKDDGPTANGLRTPQTEARSKDVFKTPAAAPASTFAVPTITKQSDPSSSQTLTPGSSPVSTPTPVRYKDAGLDGELAHDVLGVLQDANVVLNEQSRRNLNTVLSKHAIIAEGVRKSRDVARSSIKARDAKVTELIYRVNTLEAELEAERATVKHLQWKAETGHSSD